MEIDDILREIREVVSKYGVKAFGQIMFARGDLADRIEKAHNREIEKIRALASPKMYEALREAIIEVCGPCYSCSGHPEYACGLKNDSCFVKKWRAVLAEARGEVSND